ncbi:MAG: PQQ-binding-like beta-propeller repeat protein, partial [Verrucomicrobia bacterium]|nr:PQQ-binding-like beta-propeller repeat protein [Verrucomicrobiota bacterium]
MGALMALGLLGCEEKKEVEGGAAGGGDPVSVVGDEGGWKTLDWRLPRGGLELQGRVHDRVPRKLEVAWTFTADAGIIAAAAIADGVVYVGSVWGTVYALDAETGAKKWSFETEDTIEAAPTVAGGKVYVGSNYGTLHALDIGTGKEVWHYNIRDKVSASVNMVKSPDGTEDWVLMNGYDGVARCLRATDGSQVWEFATDEYINGSPAVIEGKYVVFGGCDAVVYTLNLADGKVVNEVVTESYITSTVGTYGHNIYMGNESNQVLASELLSKDLVWVYGDSEFSFFSAPAVTEKAVFIGGRDKQLHAIDRLTGKGLWKFKTGGRVDSSPLAFDDAVLFGSSDGRLYALDPADGSEVWMLDLGEGLNAPPAFAKGMIVIGGAGDTVFAVRG